MYPQYVLYEFSDNKKISQTDICLSGPPFFVPDEQVQSLFGECCHGLSAFPILETGDDEFAVFFNGASLFPQGRAAI